MTKQDNDPKIPTKKLSYQPFLLAVAALLLVSKVVIAVATNKDVVDWFFLSVLVIFLVVIITYIWEKSKIVRNKQQVTISTGSAKGSKISGIKTNSPAPQEEVVNIKTKDITNTEITGVERKEKD